ncbi:hypothetical protein CRG98_023208 [Punica granatum]|uniref:Uncharacterized protein n=1 Tax=Punica granatum TaxID=22663 RepID=A0A2I0JJG0_PUNGR|nr:hypothetical protein CRG98_023208 [Punica granatum]
MASHRLEDDLGYSLFNEVWRVWEQEGAEDQKQEPVICVALLLVDLLDGYAKEGGELASNHCERVGYKYALGGGRRPLDERRILLNCGCQLCSLEIEHCILGIPEFGGSPQEDPIHRGFSEHDHVSDNALNEGAIHRAECPLNAHDFLPKRCDCFEPGARSRAAHPYLNGGDVDSAS